MAAMRSRGTNPTCKTRASRARRQLRCLSGKLCYCSQHHGNDQGKDLYVCVCFAPEIIKVSVLWGPGAGCSDGSAVGLPRGFAATSRGGGRAAVGGRGARAAV